MLIDKLRKRFGLRTRIFVAGILPALLISALLGSYYIIRWIDEASEHIDRYGSRYSTELSKLSEFALFTNDVNFLAMLSKSFFSDPNVYSVRIMNDKKSDVTYEVSPRYSGGKHVASSAENLVFIAAVYGGQLTAINNDEFFSGGDPEPYPDLLGWVEIVMTDRHIIASRHDMLMNTLLILSAVIAMAFLMALYLSSYITRPIVNLNKNVNKIASGKMAGELNLKTGATNELGELESSFYEMALAVKNSQFELQKKIDIATASHRDTITHLEKNNMELIKARESMKKAHEEKSGFLARMSHEIRTPIQSIMGFVKLIKRTHLDNTQSEYVRVVGHASEHLLQLINDVLDISSLESNAIKLENEDLNLRDCIEDAVLFMSPAAHKKGLELVFLIDSDVPLNLTGDQYHLKQVVMNLVSNAIKFTQQGDVVIYVSLLNDGIDSAKLSISVSDTGMGIAADHIDKIQNPFFQADSTKAPDHEGAGLGLSIVKTLIDMMEGELLIKSRLGSGSRFDCVLEMRKQDDISTLQYHRLADKKVLCCDYHPLALRSVRNQLLTWTGQIYTASRLERVEELLQAAADDEHPFDLLIVGVNKITANSESFRIKLQEIKATYLLPLLLLVGDEGHSICDYLTVQGNCLCITKPVAQDYLYQSIQSILDQKGAFQHKEGLSLPASDQVGVVSNTTDDIKIMLVEDNDFNRLYVSSLLRDRGFQVSEAMTGNEAVRMAGEEGFNLILMDIHLPGMDGLVTAKKIRDECLLNNETPIIALTADVYINKKNKLKSSGINDVISKPVNETAFWQRVDKWLIAPRSNIDRYRVDDIQGQLLGDIKQRLLPRLIEELPNHRRRIHSAFVKRDRDGLAEHLHQLKGVAGYFQLADLSVAAAQADLYVREAKDMALDDVHPFIQRINETIEAIVSSESV